MQPEAGHDGWTWMNLGWFWWQEWLDIRFLRFEMHMELVVYTWAWISDPTNLTLLNISSGEAWGISVGLLWKLWMYVREDLLGYAAAHELDSQRNHCCNSTALSQRYECVLCVSITIHLLAEGFGKCVFWVVDICSYRVQLHACTSGRWFVPLPTQSMSTYIRPEVEWKSAKSKRYRTFISFKLQTVLDHLHFTILFGQCCRVYYICTFKNDYIYFYILTYIFISLYT